MELRDKVAIVTGGTSGIGKAIAQRFVREGARVAVLGRSDDDGAQVQTELCALAAQHGAGDCFYVHADVAEEADVKAAIDAIRARWKHVDIVVNNAAMMKSTSLVDMAAEDWDKTMAVNLRGPFLLAKHAIPLLPKGGVILNISSVHATATDARSAAYSASKGGLEALTRAMSIECYDRQVRVNALRLGAVDTPMLWQNPEIKSGQEKIEPREVAKPGQVAEVALFMASPRSSFMTGAVIDVDGGRLALLASHSS